MPEAVARHCSMLEKLQPRIPEMLVMQYSPACAADAVMTNTLNVNRVAADAATALEVGFNLFFFLLRQVEMSAKHDTARNCAEIHHGPLLTSG